MRDEELLEALGRAGADLLERFNPLAVLEGAPTGDLWSVPLPLAWELPVRYLWLAAADAFDVVAFVLPQRASNTVLAQVRLLMEGALLLRWLLDPEDGRQLRAAGLALKEIRDAETVWRKLRDSQPVPAEGEEPTEATIWAQRGLANLKEIAAPARATPS